jgi:guanylate kinase
MSKIALVGKAASGKDYLKAKLIKRGMEFGISTTTRPPREGEIDGVDYHFITEDQFLRHIAYENIVFYQKFNGHYYGITQQEFQSCDAVILNAEVLSKMPEEVRYSLFVIYLNIDDATRMRRMKERGFSDVEITERIYADNKQYEEFSNYDMMITNPNF